MNPSRIRLAMILANGTIFLTQDFVPARAAAPPSAPIVVNAHADGLDLVWSRRDTDGKDVAVEVVGIDSTAVSALTGPGMTRERWISFFRVRVSPEEPGAKQLSDPLWGSYEVDGNVLRFRPRFPMEPGTRYRAEFDRTKLQDLIHALSRAESPRELGPRSSTLVTAIFKIPKNSASPTSVVSEVYPSRAILPENLLRFYVHFSAPMSRGEAYDRIKLLDAAGKSIADPFLELAEELWSTDGKRFTLLFDPGRIKRGLKPREEVGPVLEAGKSYTLVIDRGWPDAEGNPLRTEFRKSFRTGPPTDRSPDLRSWKIRTPVANTRDPLEVEFPEPLDRALLDRLITVEFTPKVALSGHVATVREETGWRFTPSNPWAAGNYRLVVGMDLEDLAGNNIARPFEVDMVAPISRRIEAGAAALPFRIDGAVR